MSYKIQKTYINDLIIVEPSVYHDNRGYFFESYNKNEFSNLGLSYNFVQDNQSLSLNKGTIRGIHFQSNPFQQAKLVSCIEGEILDYAIDLRKTSDTYLKWYSINLNSSNQKLLLIPRGFGHAFITLVDNTRVLYKVDNPYSKTHERIINYLDNQINLEIPFLEDIIISEKDKTAPFLSHT